MSQFPALPNNARANGPTFNQLDPRCESAGGFMPEPAFRCGTARQHPPADAFQGFLNGLLSDARYRALVERGILPADTSMLTPETTVLRLAVALADRLDRADIHPALLTLDELDAMEVRR